MLLYCTDLGLVLVTEGRSLHLANLTLDQLLQDPSPVARLSAHAGTAPEVDGATPQVLLAPIGSQDVWAAGVTYYRSRDARMDEARESGGATFYDRVYEADRPELFFKSTAPRVVAPAGPTAVSGPAVNRRSPAVLAAASIAAQRRGRCVRRVGTDIPKPQPTASNYPGLNQPGDRWCRTRTDRCP